MLRTEMPIMPESWEEAERMFADRLKSPPSAKTRTPIYARVEPRPPETLLAKFLRLSRDPAAAEEANTLFAKNQETLRSLILTRNN